MRLWTRDPLSILWMKYPYKGKSTKRIQFYPEDMEKMENMSHNERMDYAKMLHQQNRFIELD